MASFGIKKTLDIAFDDALARVPEALKAEGFGVLTEIDVQQTLKKKLDVDFRRYRILGACNPGFAHRALAAEPMIGLLLIGGAALWLTGRPSTPRNRTRMSAASPRIFPYPQS